MTIFKDKAILEKGLPTPPNDSPPAYLQADFNTNVPDITAGFSSLNLAPSAKPTPDVCIAHLKLLEAFHQLREDVAFEDGRFGIKDAFADAGGSDKERADLLIKIREKRWQVYVTMASKRFERWWTTCVEVANEKSRLLRQSKIPTMFRQSPDVGERLAWSEDCLPPLGKHYGKAVLCTSYVLSSQTDVIMVWHAYMLNPRDFLEDCLRQGKMRFWRSGLPWAVINPCIDNNSFEYTAGKPAMEYFETQTGHKWNSLDDSLNATISCPRCMKNLKFPQTGWHTPIAWQKSGQRKESELYGEVEAAGFSDKNFKVECQCGLVIDHEVYKVRKFRTDMQALHNLDVPMPGTVLSDTGVYFIFMGRDNSNSLRDSRHSRGTHCSLHPPFLVPESPH